MDWKITGSKFLKSFLIVALTGAGVGVASPEVADLIKDNTIAASSVPLLAALIAAGLNALKHMGDV